MQLKHKVGAVALTLMIAPLAACGGGDDGGGGGSNSAFEEHLEDRRGRKLRPLLERGRTGDRLLLRDQRAPCQKEGSEHEDQRVAGAT
jgi:hypothetical protein